MIEEILHNLYRLEIPLPNSPLKALNSYVIKNTKRNLIIDTGFNRQECQEAMRAGLDELEVDLKETDLFITHMHADHFGLVSSLATDASRVYFNKPDAEWIKCGGGWKQIINYAELNGFPRGELQTALSDHPGFKYSGKRVPELYIICEGDIISAGSYKFRCVETPGHTRGHMCLYERDKKFLMAGDHILADITPNITCWFDEINPLADYLESLDKVYNLDVDLVFPGHHGIIRNCKERIGELKQHHEDRIAEVLSVLEGGSKSAFEVASGMTWSIINESWNHLPVLQKWFAAGEAIAHLRYLEDKCLITKEMQEGKAFFRLNEDSEKSTRCHRQKE